MIVITYPCCYLKENLLVKVAHGYTDFKPTAIIHVIRYSYFEWSHIIFQIDSI